MWEYSGVCSFRHVDCQKFLIRAIIKELRRLFSTEYHCLIAGYTHTEYRWRMCSLGLRLHSNYWQPYRNLLVKHVMHKPKNTLKMNMNQHVKINAYALFPSKKTNQYLSQVITGVNHFQWMGLLGFVEAFLWFVFLFVFKLPRTTFCFFQRLFCLLSESRNHIKIWMQARHIERILTKISCKAFGKLLLLQKIN